MIIKKPNNLEEAIAEVPEAKTDIQGSIDSIMSAISYLGDAAKEGNQVAKDAIADLSVVLLDLKSL